MTSVSEASADVEVLAPGVWLLRTPMPSHGLGSANAYLIASDDGLTMVDSPWGSPEVIDSFRQRIAAAGFTPMDITIVLATHYHGDHVGAAGWLQAEYGTAVAMSATDAMIANAVAAGGRELWVALRAWLTEIDADASAVSLARSQHERLVASVRPLRLDRALSDGDRIGTGEGALEVVATPGHTPGHLCFVDRDRGILLAGDHVFEHRRSNAQARPWAVSRPIEAYWRSTKRLLATGADLVLPGHDTPFRGFRERMRRLARVRDARLDEVVALAAEPLTVWQLTARIRRRAAWDELDSGAQLAAAGETHAYLIEAEAQGRVARISGSPTVWTAAAAA